MNTKQIFLAVALAALAPLAHAESPSETIFKFEDGKSVLTRAQVRAQVLNLDRSEQVAGEVYPYDVMHAIGMRMIAEVRGEARNAPRIYGEISEELVSTMQELRAVTRK
jgi:hypothetical protein